MNHDLSSNFRKGKTLAFLIMAQDALEGAITHSDQEWLSSKSVEDLLEEIRRLARSVTGSVKDRSQ
jgi:hypothetical protein